jgi:hypothetical protein
VKNIDLFYSLSSLKSARDGGMKITGPNAIDCATYQNSRFERVQLYKHRIWFSIKSAFSAVVALPTRGMRINNQKTQ